MANDGSLDEETRSFDFANRLREVTLSASSVTATYLYEPSGRRIRKEVDGATTWFVWDGDHLIGEFSGAGVLERRYTYAFEGPPEEQIVVGSGGVEVYTAHGDHLGTPKLLTGSAQEVVWRAAFTAFGVAQVDPASSVSQPFRFPGQYHDAETGTNYNYHRDYDPSIGRYLEADPIGLAGGINLYAYVDSNPLAAFDPLGLKKRKPQRRPCSPKENAACNQACQPCGMLRCQVMQVWKLRRVAVRGENDERKLTLYVLEDVYPPECVCKTGCPPDDMGPLLALALALAYIIRVIITKYPGPLPVPI